MEVTQALSKPSRSRTRSGAGSNSATTSPNANIPADDKPKAETVIDKPKTESEPMEETPAEKPADEKLPASQGRKRKASEMKSSNEQSSDEPPTKDKPVSETEGKDDQEAPSTETETKPVEAKESTTTAVPSLKPEDKDDLSAGESDVKVPDKQVFGKGKRARIPNKRYSDLPLKATRAVHASPTEADPKPKLENGETKGNETDSNRGDLSENSSPSIGSPAVANVKSTRHASSPVGSASKKSKAAVDLSNPNFLKPFQCGWKRELVYRTTNDGSNKRNADIYYYTPTGKKVRSMREVSENLKNKELTLDDFTFFKEPIGLDDPEKEIIRDAKFKNSTSTPSLVKKNTPKGKSEKANSPKPVATDSPKPTPPAKAVRKNNRAGRVNSFKIKFPSRGGQSLTPKLDRRGKDDLDLEIGAYPPDWSPPSNKTASKPATNLSDVDKPCRPCSIRCQGVSGLIPTLQCRICLCLYHNECVGLSSQITVQGYVCKNCQLDQDQSTGSAATVAPPPLTPINALKSVNTQSTTLPKLQRIPKPGDPVHSPKPPPAPPSTEQDKDIGPTSDAPETLPQLTPRPNLSPSSNLATTVTVNSAPSSSTENKSIVGSVTTWFPSSSTIQVSQTGAPSIFNNTSIITPPRPQHVEFLRDKKFLVIPKYNIVSVSPTIASVAAAPINKPSDTESLCKVAAEGAASITTVLDSASLGPNSDISNVKLEPMSPTKTNLTPRPESSEPKESGETELVQRTTDNAEENFNSDEYGDESTPPRRAKRATRTSAMEREPVEDVTFMDCFLQNVAYGYHSLLYVFQYLKVQDLLRASCVCSMWRDIASHSMLWRTVRMKNSQIHSFEGLAEALEKHGTVHLDLRKMLLPGNSNDEIWSEFSQAIKKVESLKKIELCRCPSAVIEQLAESNPNLEVINAVTIKCENMNLEPLANLKNLKELRLKSTAGFALTSNLSALSQLKHLKHLSLTSIRDLNKMNIRVIADLTNLESLDIGECTDFPEIFGSEILIKLTKLEKLRLEKGQGNCNTFEILEAVKSMRQLEQLELVNFDIKFGFDKALGACTNVKKLLLIPTYISQSATTNHMVLGGVLRLKNTLSHFVWGVTLELLRVTELFVDQCEDPEKKEKREKRPIGNGDSIPVLKPVPLLKEGSHLEILPAQDPPQVEILPLPNLQKLLLQSLPTTRVKILKIPFHATWRQSITDSVN